MVEEVVDFINIGTPAGSTDGRTTTHPIYSVEVQVRYAKAYTFFIIIIILFTPIVMQAL